VYYINTIENMLKFNCIYTIFRTAGGAVSKKRGAWESGTLGGDCRCRLWFYSFI